MAAPASPDGSQPDFFVPPRMPLGEVVGAADGRVPGSGLASPPATPAPMSPEADPEPESFDIGRISPDVLIVAGRRGGARASFRVHSQVAAAASDFLGGLLAGGAHRVEVDADPAAFRLLLRWAYHDAELVVEHLPADRLGGLLHLAERLGAPALHAQIARAIDAAVDAALAAARPPDGFWALYLLAVEHGLERPAFRAGPLLAAQDRATFERVLGRVEMLDPAVASLLERDRRRMLERRVEVLEKRHALALEFGGAADDSVHYFLETADDEELMRHGASVLRSAAPAQWAIHAPGIGHGQPVTHAHGGSTGSLRGDGPHGRSERQRTVSFALPEEGHGI
ncbi:hypothetical protein DFJ74DRAFT_723282 [Hyaloraphidium curvatum]|nr:hypothetical protein DFJ74DRAFT_723282 [Hyaloraphidium curvatum]